MLNLMAFAKSQEVREAAPIEKYLGSTIAHLEFVNPTKEELASIGINLDKEKVYVSDTKVIDVNGKESNGTQNALEFWYSFDFEGEKKYVAYKVWISNSAYIGSRTGKIQVCDHYGRFAWATPDEYKAGVIPQYSTGPAHISKEYRAAVKGEEEVIELMKAHLGLKNLSVRLADNSYRDLTDEEIKANEDEYLCYFEPAELIALCKGDVKTIKKALEGSNDVLLIFGIRHTDKGDYQTIYSIKKSNFKNFNGIESDWAKNPIQGTDILYEGHVLANLVKYEVSPTKITTKNDIKKPDNDLPF